LFREFAQAAPSNWFDKNFQIVLRNTIYGNSAGSLSVVASEIWEASRPPRAIRGELSDAVAPAFDVHRIALI
jgi:hypothetical protein